jgi:hypothetical protein
MRRVYQVPEILASGGDVYVGIDVDKESSHVTAISEGEEIFHGSMAAAVHLHAHTAGQRGSEGVPIHSTAQGPKSTSTVCSR